MDYHGSDISFLTRRNVTSPLSYYGTSSVHEEKK